nr:serine/threonine-protein phosphatase 4 regulatory subunit 2 [Osmia lignaria]XP_034193276.1 serine/threonine-protein phosphatase 4 regulatory subunit 2 [Osmia lignaria]XP_034193277.1 serine/threonine-protein phosphatase 4 regulatory subunit 2 [Osmia lignaria]XP_034193278.1 serine/threonine-protein phosphatase 4 regulatory subunit 2 [Osmia lignaria]XP_034193279.1 serine/threonine-protein phosphatase 4 regulatory subunit 2 [Osmia lignaria]
MENLEEVLQALDEFQKMRPSEIPRELEDYLCWVAKTGDPVYQWSLIKTLFREKLTRVMTDFYESCPTLDLAPCPNVEHFNYDTMKSNLLERLESFANAPFTVQRICELLTAPRKEYNRVDKFMRAIEKNILVVSTREPGPTARRNENGDGMVNGSVDEDTSVTQPPQDVEMEYWEKDCSSTVTISVHTVENETPLLQTVVPTTTVVKNVFDTEEISQEKVESTSKSDNVVSNFIPTTSEFTSTPNLTCSPQTQNSQIEPTMQNLSTMVPETSGIVSDVSEAIMNEDTSSQPSLELENDGGEITDSSRKLQTTFQTKDFSSNESKSLKFYVDNSKANGKTEVGSRVSSVHLQEESSKANDVCTMKSDIESKTVPNSKESNENLQNAAKSSSNRVEEVETVTQNAHDSTIEDKEKVVESLKNSNIEDILSKDNLEKPTDDVSLIADNTSTEESPSGNSSEDMPVDVENLKDHNKETESTEDSKSIMEDSCSKDNTTKNFNSDQEENNLTITKAIEDETRIIKSIVPDKISIIEESKDTTETINEKIEEEGTSSIIEISENLENRNPVATSQSRNENKMCVEDNHVTELEGNDITATNTTATATTTVTATTTTTTTIAAAAAAAAAAITTVTATTTTATTTTITSTTTTTTITTMIETSDTVIENTTSRKVLEPVELMDVDEEETLSVFEQSDEPMEQEAAQSSRS